MTANDDREGSDADADDVTQTVETATDSTGRPETETDAARLVEGILDGDHRALARTITKIENRSPGYRDLVADLHDHTGDAEVVGITGSPGAGKSTLVDKLAATYRDRGLTVGVIAIDPASPYTGGAVLGDRIRMASNLGDMDVFVRSMSARGTLGGLSTTTTDAIRALDAFGKDRIVVETVGAGQNEIDIVGSADTVAVLVPPGSGDDVQMLKAGILEIADLLVVNKADLDGADRTVQELREMVHVGENVATGSSGTGGADGTRDAVGTDGTDEAVGTDGTDEAVGTDEWTPPILETVANTGEGVDDLVAAIDDHREYLESSGELDRKVRRRYAEEVRTLLREDVHELLAEEIAARGGLDAHVDRVVDRETDPYSVAEAVIAPLETCVRERRSERADSGDDSGVD